MHLYSIPVKAVTGLYKYSEPPVKLVKQVRSLVAAVKGHTNWLKFCKRSSLHPKACEAWQRIIRSNLCPLKAHRCC